MWIQALRTLLHNGALGLRLCGNKALTGCFSPNSLCALCGPLQTPCLLSSHTSPACRLGGVRVHGETEVNKSPSAVLGKLFLSGKELYSSAKHAWRFSAFINIQTQSHWELTNLKTFPEQSFPSFKFFCRRES